MVPCKSNDCLIYGPDFAMYISMISVEGLVGRSVTGRQICGVSYFAFVCQCVSVCALPDNLKNIELINFNFVGGFLSEPRRKTFNFEKIAPLGKGGSGWVGFQHLALMIRGENFFEWFFLSYNS